MFKCIALLKRREDLSLKAFIDYYENHHAPLIRRLFPEIARYQRNYINTDEIYQADKRGPLDFDVVTEIYFADRKNYEHFLTSSADPLIAQQIADDEMHLFDRTATCMFSTQVHSS